MVNSRAMSIYNSSLVRYKEEGRPMWRNKEERRAQTSLKGSKIDKTAWFTRLGYSNTLSMPATPNGELMDIVNKAMKGSAAPLGFKTLVMEDGGRSVKADLVRTNPFPDGLGCGRKGCIMCNKEPSKGKCWWSNCVYKITCTRAPCTTGGVLPTYVGET